MFKYTDASAFAAKYFRGDQTAAVEALIRSGPNVRYGANNAHADATLIVAWWAAALERRLSPGMAIPGVNQTPETAVGRHLQAAEFGTNVPGQFFASAQGMFSGPMEVQRQPHLLDGANQEAAWQAVVSVSGANFLPARPAAQWEVLTPTGSLGLT